ncbi:hypothetical protein GOP47_0004480 [Adiantum capillus-veneris]|uniref:F-box domain-containing protein n=1 Tax=Adiantum capillus-veneris TaxID=13818 RepID=A0A9D4V9C7_ADICA|nr:hypothetical protein GOP47_0004480 [Adiantum capillus-veneris]
MADCELIPSLPLDLALDCLHRVSLNSLSSLQKVCSSWRALVSSPSFQQTRHAKGYMEHQACIIQATSNPGKTPAYGISIFDEKHNTWEYLPPIPDFPNGLPLFCSCVAVGAQIVILGGWDPSSWSVLTSVYIYDFARARWRCGARMPTARSFFACAAMEGKIVVAGGHDQNKNALKSAEIYDVVSDMWENLADMAQERDECKAICFNGELIVVSGFSTESQGQFMASAESLDLVERKWRTVDNFWPAGRPPSSIVLFKGQLFALLDGHIVQFKSSQNEWEPVLALPASIRVFACATPLSDGILIVGFGGAAQSLHIVRCCVGTGCSPPSWRVVNGNGSSGTVQQTACTIQV